MCTVYTNIVSYYINYVLILLFAVIFLVLVKSAINWIFGVIGILVLGILLMLGFKVYKRIRDKNPEA